MLFTQTLAQEAAVTVEWRMIKLYQQVMWGDLKVVAKIWFWNLPQHYCSFFCLWGGFAFQ